MPETPRDHTNAVTTPVGVTTICPQCGVMLDAVTTTCGACGAVITGPGTDTGRAEKVRAKLQEAIGDAFAVGELLGRGGMGMVYRAREASLDRDVALKVLAFDPSLNPDAYARFEREAKLASRLDHPHIVPIFSVGQRAGVAFYTMRLVKGGSVEQLLESGALLDMDHAIAILRDVAAALDYAHANGVVHRDIKPANILIGDSGHAMVADFGIARAFGGDAAATATSTGVVGSPAYMSPEQWRGEKVDGRADQYALGVLAFELLTGKRPFATASMQELVRMHLAEDPPDILSYRANLPSHTTDTVWRALSKDPADRFETSSQFIDALAGTGTVPARPPKRPPSRQPAPPPAPRRMWPAVVMLVALAGVAGAIVVNGVKARRTAAVAAAVPVAPAEPPHAHIVVIARGGTPRIFVDGRPTMNSAPAVVEVPPGKHTITVRGAPTNPFTPGEYNLDLAPNDTQQVVFMSQRASGEPRRQRFLQSGDSLRKAKRPPE